MDSLLDSIKTSFSHPLVGHLAARLGEGVTGINKALDNIVPLVLGGIIQKANSGGAQSVFDVSQQAYRAASTSLGSITGLLGIIGRGTATFESVWPGANLLEKLLEASGQQLAGPISEYAGIKMSSAATLCEMVGAVLLTLLGQHAAQHHLTADGTAAELASLQTPVHAMLTCNLPSRAKLLWLSEAVQAVAQIGAHSRWLRLLSATGTALVLWVGWGCSE